MATAHKHTKTETRTVTEEVTTYTLELTAEEAEWLAAHLGVSAQRSGYAADIEQELRRQAATPNPQPLAVGDRVRVLREYRERQGRDTVQPGEYRVESPTPDEDNEIVANGPGIAPYYYLPADGEGTVWERI